MGSSSSASKPLGRATVALHLDFDLAIMESLACAETVTDFLDICMNNSVAVPASSDPVLTQDRVVEVMLGQEETRKIDYLATMQPELRPHMRRIVTDWMLEVCEDQEAGTEVFLLAVHYLDTFVSSTLIRKSQFQLAAATCLLIASKMLPHSTPFLTSSLVDYTDNCYTKQEIVAWEVLILHRLQWNLTTTTAASMLRQLCSSSLRLGELHQEGLELVVVVQAFLPLASLPSPTLALASLAWLSRTKEGREEVEELSKSLAVESHELD